MTHLLRAVLGWSLRAPVDCALNAASTMHFATSAAGVVQFACARYADVYGMTQMAAGTGVAAVSL